MKINYNQQPAESSVSLLWTEASAEEGVNLYMYTHELKYRQRRN